MVLSTPLADAGAARAPAWLAKLVAQLELSQRGILLALVNVAPTQLGDIVRALSKEPPWVNAPVGEALEVCLRAPELADLPPHSRVLLRVRLEDLDWLNIHRPMFSERALRAVLWLDDAAHQGLLRRAADLYDWVSRLVKVPDAALPSFAFDGLRAAFEVGLGIVWRGVDLQWALAEIGWADGVVELEATDLHAQLLARLRAPGLPVVSGIRSEHDAWRVRLALAHAGREGAWVAKDPVVELPGMVVVHDRQADWERAAAQLAEAGAPRPELLAAWLNLEPERIEAACVRACEAPPDPASFDIDALACACAPAWALRARASDELRLARARIVAGAGAPEDPATLVCWAEGSEAWRGELGGASEARLVRALRELGDRVPSAELIEAARDGMFVDVALELALRRARAAVAEGAADEADPSAHIVAELAQALAFEGRLLGAERALRECVELTERAHGTRQHAHVASTLESLAGVLVDLGKYAEAERFYREALAIGEAPRPSLGHGLAAILVRQGKYAEAEASYRKSIDIAVKAHGTREHPDFAASLTGLANLLVRMGRYDEAEEAYRESIKIQVNAYGTREHVDVAASLQLLANVLYSQAKYADAEKTYRESIKIQVNAYGTHEHPDVAASLHGLANVLFSQGKYADAEKTYRESIEIQNDAYGTLEHPEVAASLHGLANVLERQGKYADAEKTYRESIQIQDNAYGTREHPEVADSLHGLANLLYSQGKYAEAERTWLLVVGIEERVYGSRRTAATIPTLAMLAQVLLELGRPKDALAWSSEAWLAATEEQLLLQAIQVGPIHLNCLLKNEDREGASELMPKLQHALTQFPEDHPTRQNTEAQLAQLLARPE